MFFLINSFFFHQSPVLNCCSWELLLSVAQGLQVTTAPLSRCFLPSGLCQRDILFHYLQTEHLVQFSVLAWMFMR